MKILVVAAHPDDEVLGCGGTISRLSGEGHELCALILGEGITSRHPERKQEDLPLIRSLQNSCRKSAGSLGVKEAFFHQLPDNRFDTVPILDIIKIIEESVNRVEPRAIYTHHGGDLNIDHVITHRAVMTAVRPMKECMVEDVYAYEIASSTEWSFQQFQPVFKPNVFINITDTIDAKIAAMQYYENEIRLFPHPRSPEALRINARRWGSVIGVEYAEAFELIRSLR